MYIFVGIRNPEPMVTNLVPAAFAYVDASPRGPAPAGGELITWE
ncbi:hypothetical protein ACWG8W_01215 [Citricoccus zhacaiensis]